MQSKYRLPVIQPNGRCHDDQPKAPSLPKGRTLTLAQVRHEYPCESCSAPCCTYLPLHNFNVSSMRELDHALYLLNFPRIELGLNTTGGWGVYYRYPCRFLDRHSSLCTIYGKETRPSICAHYNPYSCWYKQVLGPAGASDADESFLRIDRRRMMALVEHLTFDENLNIIGSPSWPNLLAMLAELPLSAQYDEGFDDDPVFNGWLQQVAEEVRAPKPIETQHSYVSLSQPCEGCDAFCCKNLIFPQAVPASRVSLDYLQFVLGFPGLEVGISNEAWFVIVKTTCQHLVENRCSIFGKPERPQICTFYDAHGCQYVAQFGAPRPNDFMRIRLDQFYWLVEPIGFDQHGNITYMPQVEDLRQHVENRLGEHPGAQSTTPIPQGLSPAIFPERANTSI